MTTLILQPGATGLDTRINEGVPANNYGASSQVLVGDNGGNISRALIAFDISALPAEVNVDSATLTLYCNSEANATDRDVGVHKAITEWFEGDSVGGPIIGDGSTWALRNNNGAVPWAGGAGGASGSDWTATATDTTTITRTGDYFTWDVLADVRSWHTGAANYGWWLINTDEVTADTRKNFRTSDTPTAAQRPKLTIEYTAGTVSDPPTPIILGAGPELRAGIGLSVFTKYGADYLLSATPDALLGYRHEIVADGGYASAGFTVHGSLSDIDVWLRDGLMRHIEVYDHAQAKIWEGFVNELEVRVGAATVRRGPVLNIANKVAVIYQTINWNTNPPVGGDRTVSSFQSDASSQAAYGIFEHYVSGGTGDSAEMEQVRDTYLEENRWPETSPDLSLMGSGGEPSVSVSCVGYYRLLEHYYYTDTAASTHNASAKIEDILSQDPNSVFSTDYSRINANTFQVGHFDDDEKDAWGAISDVVGKGDNKDNRHTFGIYNERRAEYGAVPTDYDYTFYVSSRDQRVRTRAGAVVEPWNVRPNRWLMIADLLPTETAPATLAEDPRAVFIESVTYTAPYDVNIGGGRTDTLPQKLAKMGLGGMAAPPPPVSHGTSPGEYARIAAGGREAPKPGTP